LKVSPVSSTVTTGEMSGPLGSPAKPSPVFSHLIVDPSKRSVGS
jgi:hypothetical protein